MLRKILDKLGRGRDRPREDGFQTLRDQAEWFNGNGGLRRYLSGYLNRFDQERVQRWSTGMLRDEKPFSSTMVKMAAVCTRMVIKDGRHDLEDDEVGQWLTYAEVANLYASGELDDAAEERLREIERDNPALSAEEAAMIAFRERTEWAKERWAKPLGVTGNPFGYKL